jgi:hypothetical protein
MIRLKIRQLEHAKPCGMVPRHVIVPQASETTAGGS